MGMSQFDPSVQHRRAWNDGATISKSRPLKQKQIRAIRFDLDREQRFRDMVQGGTFSCADLADCSSWLAGLR